MYSIDRYVDTQTWHLDNHQIDKQRTPLQQSMDSGCTGAPIIGHLGEGKREGKSFCQDLSSIVEAGMMQVTSDCLL